MSTKLEEIQTLAKSYDQKLHQEFGDKDNVLGMGGTLFLGKHYAESNKIFFGLNPGTWKAEDRKQFKCGLMIKVALGGVPILSFDIGKIVHSSLPSHLSSVIGLKTLPALS